MALSDLFRKKTPASTIVLVAAAVVTATSAAVVAVAAAKVALDVRALKLKKLRKPIEAYFAKVSDYAAYKIVQDRLGDGLLRSLGAAAGDLGREAQQEQFRGAPRKPAEYHEPPSEIEARRAAAANGVNGGNSQARGLGPDGEVITDGVSDAGAS